MITGATAGIGEACAVGVSAGDQLLLVTSGGQVIRMNTADMRPIGRDTQGVRLIDLAEGDSVVSIASLGEPESEDEAAEAEQEPT